MRTSSVRIVSGVLLEAQGNTVLVFAIAEKGKMMARPLFTPEELEEMRLFDEGIEAEFAITDEELEAANYRDRITIIDNSYGSERTRRMWEEASREKRKARQHERYWSDPEAARAKSKKYRDAHKEEEAARKREWYLANRDRILAHQRAYKEANREKLNAYYRARNRRGDSWYQRNREEYLAKQRKFREENKEKISEQRKSYYRKNREKILSRQKQYNARRKEERKADAENAENH
jgi:hypothetical protein